MRFVASGGQMFLVVWLVCRHAGTRSGAVHHLPLVELLYHLPLVGAAHPVWVVWLVVLVVRLVVRLARLVLAVAPPHPPLQQRRVVLRY